MKANQSDTTTTQPSTALALRPTAALPVRDMGEIATAGALLAQASFLGARNAGEGFLVAAACHQSGLSLVEFQQKFHLRQGRFSMQAHAILDEFVQRGGKYKLLERSEHRAAIELNKDGNVYLSELTWDQAADEPFVYAGNEDKQFEALKKPVEQREIKAKYRTPRSRMQMLWARVISDGVVVVDPGARSAYTPEEVEDFAPERSTPAPITPDEAARRAKPVEATTFAAPDASVCPALGTEYDGRPWSDIPTEALENALAYDGPELRSAHKAAIRLVMEAREGVES